MTSQIPEGWYADPSQPPDQPPQLRYWDGQAWTEHVTPGQRTGPSPHDQLRSNAGNPYGANPYGANPYGANPYGANPYGASPYGGGPAAYSRGGAWAAPGPTTPDGERLAGWWWRVLAYLIDAVAVGVVNALVSLPAQMGFQRDLDRVTAELDRQLVDPSVAPDLGGYFGDLLAVYRDHIVWLTLPGLVLTALYAAVFLRWKGATPGKLAVGMRVRTWEAPGVPGWRAIGLRVLFQQWLPSLAIVLGILTGSWAVVVPVMLVVGLYVLLDPLWASWDKRRQTLHDKAAGTVVVRPRRGL